MSGKTESLHILINEAARDLMPPGKAPLTPEETTTFGEALAASIRKMPDVHSVTFSGATGTITIVREPASVVRFPMTFTVVESEDKS